MLDVPSTSDIPNLTNYVQKTDIATYNTAGVVKVGGPSNSNEYGIGIIDNQLKIQSAWDSNIKAGSHDYRPITASKQHQAVFYGLAKAAGDTTQSQSNNAVGTYTDEAIAAIKEMLEIQDGLKVVRLI